MAGMQRLKLIAVSGIGGVVNLLPETAAGTPKKPKPKAKKKPAASDGGEWKGGTASYDQINRMTPEQQRLYFKKHQGSRHPKNPFKNTWKGRAQKYDNQKKAVQHQKQNPQGKNRKPGQSTADDPDYEYKVGQAHKRLQSEHKELRGLTDEKRHEDALSHATEYKRDPKAYVARLNKEREAANKKPLTKHELHALDTYLLHDVPDTHMKRLEKQKKKAEGADRDKASKAYEAFKAINEETKLGDDGTTQIENLENLTDKWRDDRKDKKKDQKQKSVEDLEEKIYKTKDAGTGAEDIRDIRTHNPKAPTAPKHQKKKPAAVPPAKPGQPGGPATGPNLPPMPPLNPGAGSGGNGPGRNTPKPISPGGGTPPPRNGPSTPKAVKPGGGKKPKTPNDDGGPTQPKAINEKLQKTIQKRLADPKKWEKPEYNEEAEEFDRVAQSEGLDPKKMKAAFKKAKQFPLHDAGWTKLENTDSNEPDLDWDKFHKLSEQYGRQGSYERIANDMIGGKVKTPIIVRYEDPNAPGKTKLHLVGGNTRLMMSRLLGVKPQVTVVDMAEHIKPGSQTKPPATLRPGPKKAEPKKAEKEVKQPKKKPAANTAPKTKTKPKPAAVPKSNKGKEKMQRLKPKGKK